MARLLVVVLGVMAVVGGMPGAAAQIDPVDELTDTIEETAEGVGEAVGQTTEESLDTVEQAGGSVTGTVGGTEGAGDATDPGGSVTGTVSESPGDVGATSPATAGPGEARGAAGSPGQRAPNASPGAGVAFTRMTRLVAETRAAYSPGAAAYVPLVVRLTNDADGDGSYSDAEVAPVADADVPFQVRLENVGSNELALLAVRDTSPTPMAAGYEALCGRLAGIRLAPGQSTSCRFTAEGFAPPEGDRVVSVFEVDVADTSQPSTTGTVADTTVVKTATGSVLGEFIRRALASTGARFALLSAVAAGLAVLGYLFIVLGNRRRRPNGGSPRWIAPFPLGGRVGSGERGAHRPRRTGARNRSSMETFSRRDHSIVTTGLVPSAHRPARASSLRLGLRHQRAPHGPRPHQLRRRS